ncbi:MAG: nuclear transport factor 2 family protein [Holophagales bacterium]|nr:nuclear transport factor 2 family protein [Holophagales bacterium]
MKRTDLSSRSSSARAVAIMILVVFWVAPVSDVRATENASLAAEKDLVREAVEDFYVRALKTRDFSLIEAVCIAEARLMSAGRDGVLRITTLEKWSRRFDPEAPPPFQHLSHSIEKIDVVGTAAQVKIQFVIDHERPVTDFLSMLKVDGRWRVSHIIDY